MDGTFETIKIMGDAVDDDLDGLVVFITANFAPHRIRFVVQPQGGVIGGMDSLGVGLGGSKGVPFELTGGGSRVVES